MALPARKSRKRRWKAIIAGLLLLSAAAIGSAYFLMFSDWPGGMRPSYAATDGDARLTRAARTAVPIIAALQKYHDQHGRYPADVSKLIPLLPAGVVNVSGQHLNGWTYYRSPKPDGFVLWLPLGWDPALLYRRDGPTGTWNFDPGDGSPEKALVLHP